ncbi:MAG: family acetyltransferase [Chitinophagaceae bacterium]|nr:family acetyltransferase [Chitinophagaceae bacterium]
MNISLQDISIRTELETGDLGHVVMLHGLLYKQEYHYGIEFESYVAEGLHEFYRNYDSTKDCVWICEYHGELAGFLLLMHRENNSAQLRYFIIKPAFRGIGLGKKLMDLYFAFLKSCHYQSSYLWTTSALLAAAALYTRYGFRLTTEVTSTAFGQPVTEQRYDWRADY